MTFSANAYRASASEYGKTWAKLDSTLRKLCLANPKHNDSAAVHAKVWIIGRTFMTGIERAVPSDKSQGSSAKKVAKHLLDHHVEVDHIFAPIARLQEPLTMAKLTMIIEAHAAFLQLMNMITTRSPRSFASKYMHFHAPLVPIYDDVANRSLTKRVRWQHTYYADCPKKCDDQYAWYAVRFFQLYKKASRDAGEVTVRLLEFSLLGGDI